MTQMGWIPQQLKDKHVQNRKPVRQPPSITDMESIIKNAARQCSFEIKNLAVEDNHDGVIETEIPTSDFHDIIVRYNPASLRRFTDEQLLALCRHEIYHPIIIKDTTSFPVLDGAQEFKDFQADVVFSYDEMINYKEYVKKFPMDKILHSAKENEFSNFSIIFLTTKYKIENNLLLYPLEPTRMALSIYQDAAYYFFEGLEKLQKWAKENQSDSLFTFWGWLHKDFDFISNSSSSRQEALMAIRPLTGILLSVDAPAMFISNRISFSPDFNLNIQGCREKFTSTQAKNIIENWESRFQSQGSIMA